MGCYFNFSWIMLNFWRDVLICRWLSLFSWPWHSVPSWSHGWQIFRSKRKRAAGSYPRSLSLGCWQRYLSFSGSRRRAPKVKKSGWEFSQLFFWLRFWSDAIWQAAFRHGSGSLISLYSAWPSSVYTGTESVVLPWWNLSWLPLFAPSPSVLPACG